MIAWRSLLMLALTVVTLFAIVFTLLAGYGLVMAEVWEHHPLDYETAEGEWIWIDDQPIYYRTWGWERGPQVVLVHGFQIEGQEMWSNTAQYLADAGLYVVAVDLKGFGRSARDASPNYSIDSQAAILARVLNQLNIGEATVVGHGWGGAVAMQLAVDQPRFVGQLVLISPRVHGDGMSLWRGLADAPLIDRAVAWTMAGGGPLWALSQRLGFYDYSRADEEYRRAVQQATRIVGTVDALLAMAASPHDGPPLHPERIGVPTHIVLGEQDGRAVRREALRLEKDLPNARLFIIPEGGHYVQMEQYRVVNRIITEICLPDEPPTLTGIDSPYQRQFSR
ncbi:MAG TPA: alpha/beta hydrolase [Chloroflexi bacterium]|jgi:pimeloyl-ACP methyl ester carboxylesterase|nr:alpha/beta hydrolase [Chloroflexota bacterium]